MCTSSRKPRPRSRPLHTTREACLRWRLTARTRRLFLAWWRTATQHTRPRRLSVSAPAKQKIALQHRSHRRSPLDNHQASHLPNLLPSQLDSPLRNRLRYRLSYHLASHPPYPPPSHLHSPLRNHPHSHQASRVSRLAQMSVWAGSSATAPRIAHALALVLRARATKRRWILCGARKGSAAWSPSPSVWTRAARLGQCRRSVTRA
jgi:hypothetical protein